MIKKDTGLIDWQKSAQEIHNLVRGLHSFSSAYTFLNGTRLKIHRTRLTNETAVNLRAGEIIRADKGGLFVACGGGEKTDVLEILEMQPDGKRQMSAVAFLSGAKLTLPAVFMK